MPRIFFSILSLKMATFSASWALSQAARGDMAPAPLGSASVCHRSLLPIFQQACSRVILTILIKVFVNYTTTFQTQRLIISVCSMLSLWVGVYYKWLRAKLPLLRWWCTGFFLLQIEHLVLWSVPIVVVLLCVFFMLKHGTMPTLFSSGIITPILKDKHGNKSNINNYTAITLSPCSTAMRSNYYCSITN